MSPPDTLIEGDGFRLRAWRVEDAASLVHYANDVDVSRGLSDSFPYPYTLSDAETFLAKAASQSASMRAIEIDGAAVGGIGMRPGEDVYRIGTQIGYWIGTPLRGRGLMSRIVPAWCDHLFASYGFERLQALVFSNNPASGRVLEKAGFIHEGTQRRAAIKRGEVLDVLVYARLRAAPSTGGPDQEPRHD
jgi:RimJ/RimL family protein N-acetyltransferase